MSNQKLARANRNRWIHRYRLATAQLFAQQGAHVYITGRRKDELDAAVKLIGHENVTAVCGDVSNKVDLDCLYEVVKTERNQIDVLFANAGILESMPLETITEEHFDKLFNIIVKGLVFTVYIAQRIYCIHQRLS